MGFFAKASSALRSLARRDDPLRNYRWVNVDAPSGILITPESALNIAAVWACVNAITNAIASCAWNVFEVTGEKREWLTEDPLGYLLNTRPNPDMPAISFKETLMFGALTWGNGYAEIVRNGRGQPQALWPLLPDRVVPRRRPETNELYYDAYQEDGGIVELPAMDVFHLRGPGISGLMGDNLIARAAKSMALASAQERFASTYFGNNTLIGGVLETSGKLTPDAHARLKQDWEDRYKGPFKSNKPVILEGGVKWTPTEVDLDKAQALDSRMFSIEEICRFYNVPPHKVQHLLRSTFNNIEHLGIEFTRDALTPWSLRLEQEADYKLLPPKLLPRKATKLDMGWLTHGDFKSRMEGYAIGRNMGVFSANEIRAFEGKNGIGALGDVRIVAVNMTTLERLVEGPALPAANDDEEGEDSDSADAEPDEGGNGGNATETDTAGGQDSSNALRTSIQMLFESALGRYQKKQNNRSKNLKNDGADDQKVALNLARSRVEWRAELLEEVSGALDLALNHFGSRATPETTAIAQIQALLAADSMDSGAAAVAVAEQLFAVLTSKELAP